MRLDLAKPLYDRTGPWVSAYLDASRETEDGAELTALRWRGLRQHLADQGAPDGALAALDEVVADAATGLAMFAADGRVALTVPLPEPPARDIGTVGRLPHVLPMFAALGEPVAWVQVVADRTGADLVSAPAWRRPRTDEVTGQQHYPVHKAAPGGWSQPRYQRAAEENWERNAAEVAAAVARAAEQVDAEALVVAGDVRARQLILEHLPERWAAIAVPAEGSRAPGATPEPVDEATRRATAEVAARRRAAALDDLHAGGGTLGATGLAEVVEAARETRIRTVLLRIGDRSEGLPGQVWIGSAPTVLATAPDDFADQPVRADDALLRAAAQTDAELMLYRPDELPDEVAAVLRW